MRARAPASSANLGPGFDALALALNLHVEVEVEAVPGARLTVRTEGEGAHFLQDSSHLAARVAIDVAGHDHLSISVRSEIPAGRGLGSSAALAVAAAAAAGSPDAFGVAARFEGHAENAAASRLGGLVAAAMVAGGPVACRLALDPGLCFAVVVPDRSLSTEEARATLREDVTREDAAFNLGRMGLLVAGLADRSQLVSAAGEDRLHQPQRTVLSPEAPELLERLLGAGATVACWSGAGPSVLGICDGRAVAERVRDAGERALELVGLTGRALVLEPDLVGLVVD